MVNRVANHVQQRVLDVFEDGGINFHVAAADFQPCDFAVAGGDVADGALKLAKVGPMGTMSMRIISRCSSL